MKLKLMKEPVTSIAGAIAAPEPLRNLTRCCVRNLATVAGAVIVAGVLIFVSSMSSAEDKKSCKQNPKVNGACFEVRGRMAFYNGAPSVRIWPVGTNRLLGVSEARFYLKGYENIDPALVSQLSWGKAMYANFEVCPFTANVPGVMRLVCVESAMNITVREWKR